MLHHNALFAHDEKRVIMPDVVIKHSPMNNQISYLKLIEPISPFELGICVQEKRLQEPIIKAFWALLPKN